MVKILRENNNEIKQIPLECISDVTLLSKEEAESLLTQEERRCKCAQEVKGNGLYVNSTGDSIYWLRSGGRFSSEACVVGYDGNISNICFVNDDYVGLRPALILNLSSSNLKVGDSFEFGDCTFKIISSNLALCDAIVEACPFNKKLKDGNDYEVSFVKQRVDNWFDMRMQDAKDISQGIKTNKMIADENDFGF